jgi:hypothetical protein
MYNSFTVNNVLVNLDNCKIVFLGNRSPHGPSAIAATTKYFYLCDIHFSFITDHLQIPYDRQAAWSSPKFVIPMTYFAISSVLGTDFDGTTATMLLADGL